MLHHSELEHPSIERNHIFRFPWSKQDQTCLDKVGQVWTNSNNLERFRPIRTISDKF